MAEKSKEETLPADELKRRSEEDLATRSGSAPSPKGREEEDDGVAHRDPETCPCGTVVTGPVEDRPRFADGSVWCGTCDGVRYDD